MLCRQGVKWIYCLPDDYSWRCPFPVGRDYAFQDKDGRTRLIIKSDGTLTVTKGYAWDGCSPKFCFLDLVIGTPDGVVFAGTGQPKTYFASLVHDALYQFLPDGLPLSRAQADRCFLLLMSKSEFRLRYLYYAAVRLCGWITLPITRRIRRYKGRRLDLRELERIESGLTTG